MSEYSPGNGRMADLYVSVVVPLLNEVDNLRPLHSRLSEVLAELGKPYEVIFVDDGSTDGSWDVLRELFTADEHVRVIKFRRNFGKTAGLSAGFRYARGEVFITMDADLQDDPLEIPKMLKPLEEGADLVAAWRHKRNDPLTKTFPSRVFNLMVSVFTGTSLHDINCGFKVYRREVARGLRLYGDLHRFTPVLAAWHGFNVAEQRVVHHARRAGRSKYGGRRFMRGILDLMMVFYITNYALHPLRLFGPGGALIMAVGFLINVYMTVLWLMGHPIGTRPLLMLGVLLMVVGVQIVSIGLLGEMLRYLTFQPEQEYSITRVLDRLEEAGE